MENRWENNGNSDRFYFGGASKSLQFGDCSHEIKGHLLLGRKAMTNLDSILKSRDITWLTNVHVVKATVFPVVMYECESGTIKKAEHQRIDAFELWCWRRLKSPLDCKEIQPVHPKGNQSWIFIGRTDVEAEAAILWPAHWKRLWCWERLKVGGEEDDRGWDVWMASLTRWTWTWASPGSWWWTGKPGMVQSMGSQRAGHDGRTEWTDWK